MRGAIEVGAMDEGSNQKNDGLEAGQGSATRGSASARIGQVVLGVGGRLKPGCRAVAGRRGLGNVCALLARFLARRRRHERDILEARALWLGGGAGHVGRADSARHIS